MNHAISQIIEGQLSGENLKEFVAQSFITDCYIDEPTIKMITLVQYRQGGEGIYPTCLREEVSNLPVLRTQIAAIEKWTTEDCAEMAEQSYTKHLVKYRAALLQRQGQVKRLQSLLGKLKTWKPVHESLLLKDDQEVVLTNLKENTVGTIEYYIESFSKQYQEPIQLTGEEWREETIANLKSRIDVIENQVARWEKNRLLNLALIDTITDGE